MNSEKIEGFRSLQIPVTDKENIPAKNIKQLKNLSKIKSTAKKIPLKAKTLVDIKNNINRAKEEKTDNDIKKVSAEDLKTDTPSENYWQQLAESRRLALEVTIKENANLHDKISKLKNENQSLQEMLDEAKTLIAMLGEMVEKNKTSNLS